MRSTLLGLLLCLSIFASSIKKEPDEERDLSKYREAIHNLFPNIPEFEIENGARLLQSHERNRSLLLQQRKDQKHLFQQIPPFDCTPFPPSPEIPDSVDKLRPGDIKIIAALGDSQTAGFGAKAHSIFHILNEYRGVSWSIGGDCDINEVKTLPNALKIYNPDLYGYSTGIGHIESPDSMFNRAISGSRAPSLLVQAFDLIGKMKSDPKVNMDLDWKLITIWIGSNDLCDICEDPAGLFSPDQYELDIRAVMSLIKSEIPRVFVNLIQGIDVTLLHEVDSCWCRWLHRFECSCGSSDNEEVRNNVTSVLRAYNERLVSIATDPIYNTDDMAVVIQPFLTNTSVPRNEDGTIDMDYFAPDCFHFSALSHEAAAVALWNNMFEPVHQKKLDWVPGEPFECPPPGSFLFTNRNSGYKDGNGKKQKLLVIRKFFGLWIALSMMGGAALFILLIVIGVTLYMKRYRVGYRPI